MIRDEIGTRFPYGLGSKYAYAWAVQSDSRLYSRARQRRNAKRQQGKARCNEDQASVEGSRGPAWSIRSRLVKGECKWATVGNGCVTRREEDRLESGGPTNGSDGRKHMRASTNKRQAIDEDSRCVAFSGRRREVGFAGMCLGRDG